MKSKIDLHNKKFGIFISIIFLTLLIYLYYFKSIFSLFILFLSVLFFVLGVSDSKLLKPLQIFWIKFGYLLNKLITPIIMFVIYFFVIFPISILLKIFGKDILNLNKKNKKTFWIKKEEIKSDMRNQF